MNIERLNKIGYKISGILAEKLINLKRIASGRLINSLKHHVDVAGDNIEIRVTGEDYWKQVQYGTPADRIPYSGGRSSGAKSSKYIQGLMNWIRIKGLASSDEKVKQIAFAIANKHRKEGNPMDKNKLGFVTKAQANLQFIQDDLALLYQEELDKFANDNLPKNINF